MEKTKELVLEIIKSMVSKPDEVEIFVTDISDAKGAIKQISVKVAKEDVGLCIGVGGQNSEALRRIVSIIGFQQTKERIYIRMDNTRFSE